MYQRVKRAVVSGPSAWCRAVLGALAALTIILLAAAFGMFGQAAPARFLVGTVFSLASFAMLGSLLALIWKLLRGIPLFYVWVLACAVLALALMALTAISVSIGILLTGLGTLAISSFLDASMYGLTGSGCREASRLQRFITLGGLLCGFVGGFAGGGWLLGDGSTLVTPPNAAAQSGARVELLAATDPFQPEPFAVRSMNRVSITLHNL